MSYLTIKPELLKDYPDVYTTNVLNALEVMAPLNAIQKDLMAARNKRRLRRIQGKEPLNFLDATVEIGPECLRVGDIRSGKFDCSTIPDDLQCQWIQGTGPAAKPDAPLESSIRNVAYALLSGADGWMFDGEDALGQVKTMSLDNQRNLKLAIRRDIKFLEVAEAVAEEMNAWSVDFFGRAIVQDWRPQLEFTTVIFRARGLHLDDRHIITRYGDSFSASVADVTLYVVNNYQQLMDRGSSIVLYLPKIQTAEEAAFWHVMLSRLEDHLRLPIGTIKTYVLVEQLEATFQLLEIRAALGLRFVGFNTGRWDYINSVSDALCGDTGFLNPNIEEVGMTYSYMAAYEDRVRKAVNTPDQDGRFSLWQGGMEPNIPVGSAAGVKASMEKALAGARRELEAGASGKWVAHWKMVHIIRPVWEKSGALNQLGRAFGQLTYDEKDREGLLATAPAPRTIRGARNLLSVALQYGNAFLQGFQAAALKPADFFGDPNILYLMEDMATGEIRVSVLWEWLHKRARFTESDPEISSMKDAVFTEEIFTHLLEEEYRKLLEADSRDVHEDSKYTSLPIARAIVETYVKSATKCPWFIDLLNLNLNNQDLEVAEGRIKDYFHELNISGKRITANPELKIENITA